jgi:hypothetical protein
MKYRLQVLITASFLLGRIGAQKENNCGQRLALRSAARRRATRAAGLLPSQVGGGVFKWRSTSTAKGRWNDLGRAYVILTFQKTGAANLRTPWTFFRKAVGWNHSPHGTYVTSLSATFWISSASCFRFV